MAGTRYLSGFAAVGHHAGGVEPVERRPETGNGPQAEADTGIVAVGDAEREVDGDLGGSVEEAEDAVGAHAGVVEGVGERPGLPLGAPGPGRRDDVEHQRLAGLSPLVGHAGPPSPARPAARTYQAPGGAPAHGRGADHGAPDGTIGRSRRRRGRGDAGRRSEPIVGHTVGDEGERSTGSTGSTVRTLVVAGEYPWPCNSGSRLRLATVLRGLAACGPADLFSVLPSVRADIDPPDPAAGLDRVGRVAWTTGRPPASSGSPWPCGGERPSSSPARTTAPRSRP